MKVGRERGLRKTLFDELTILQETKILKREETQDKINRVLSGKERCLNIKSKRKICSTVNLVEENRQRDDTLSSIEWESEESENKEDLL